jgi:hypothetical protein
MPRSGTNREPSWLRLQADVALIRGILSVAAVRDAREVHPEVYLFLGDRYWRLAKRHFDRGRHRRAERLERQARLYFKHGGGSEPPPLAATALPVPATPSLLWAVAGSTYRGGSGDAA